MGSADWMPRNLDKRVEIMFPVEDPRAEGRGAPYPADSAGGQCKGAYPAAGRQSTRRLIKEARALVCAQEYFCEEAVRRGKDREQRQLPERVFIPMEAEEV